MLSPLWPELLRLLTLAYLALAAAAALGVGGLFFLKRSGVKTANAIFGTLLLLGGGVQLHFILAYAEWVVQRPELAYLPIYYSLSLPVLLFYYVKLNLYPHYRLRGTDAKHFLLPLGQFFFLWGIWWMPDWRQPGGRSFYNPFYGGLEQAIFLVSFPMYLFFARTYLRARRRQLGGQGLPRMLWYLHKLIKGTFFFVLAYGILGVSDFLVYKFFHLNLRDVAWFAALAAGSYASLLAFWAVYGFQVLLWGRRLLRQQPPATKKSSPKKV